MNHARSSISSSSGAVAGATRWVLIKILIEARNRRENSSAERDGAMLLTEARRAEKTRPEDGYLYS